MPYSTSQRDTQRRIQAVDDYRSQLQRLLNHQRIVRVPTLPPRLKWVVPVVEELFEKMLIPQPPNQAMFKELLTFRDNVTHWVANGHH